MEGFHPSKLTTGPRIQDGAFVDYLHQVANSREMLRYKTIAQHGAKQGESLYVHILNGIMLLEALRPLLRLTEQETRLLFTVFTIHDINKDPDFSGRRYIQVAIPDNFEQQIHKFNLDAFFPDYGSYLADITRLAAQHGGHSGGLSLVAPLANRGLHRLLDLIRAVDVLDLSQTLEERAYKASFLSHLNALIDDRQYTFYLHSLTENRGTLSNLIHEAIVETLHEQGLIALLYYPYGVAYLAPQGELPTVGATARRQMAQSVAAQLNELTGREFESFVTSGIQGIKVDPKCLELGIPFATLWNVMHRRVETRSLKRDELLAKIVERTRREFDKRATANPEVAARVRQQLNAPQSLLPNDLGRLRDGELIRTYYIFLNSHLAEAVPDAWSHIYDLLDVPAETRAELAFFDPRWDRPYVLARELALSHADLYDAIEADGTALLGQSQADDDKVALFDDYLARYALFGPPGGLRAAENRRFGEHLRQYVTTQHRQCVHCSTTFPTNRWMTNDVRSDITVQTFSNRLRGGPGEPKKFICRLCQLQFLVERLNYEVVRDEDTMYLHLFPYSFLPAPYLTALRAVIDDIRHTDAAMRALWCDTHAALLDQASGIDPHFATQTKKGQPHPFGIYMPRITRNTVGNRLIFPINPAGNNDSSRFLFALWNALVLQEHLGLRVMLTKSPVAPFSPDSDLYIDNVALSCRGLVDRNAYAEFADPAQPDGERPLRALRQQAVALHRIVDQVRTTGERDEMLALVQAMAAGPLHLYYAAEKLLEARVREQKKASSPEWLVIRLSQHIFSDLQSLVLSKGGRPMAELSEHLQRLAEIAWQRHLRGRSLNKNALVMPLDEIFQRLGQTSSAFDEAALKAVIIQDIFEYLKRIADERYPVGRRRMEAATEFVDIFFRDIANGVYRGNRTRLLTDEKPLRSAFLFYMRQQIPVKSTKPNEGETFDEFNDVSES